MKLALVFPGGEAFAPGIGRELFEHHEPMREVARVHDEATGTRLAPNVFHPVGEVRLDDRQRLAAVVAVSVGFHRVLQSVTEVRGDVLVGRGVGRLSALVAAEALDLATALEAVLSGLRNVEFAERVGILVSGLDGSPVDRTALAEAEQAGWASEPVTRDTWAALAAARDVTAMLEIGPGDEVARLTRQVADDGFVVGALDETANAQAVLDTLSVGKYQNMQFLAERTLGQMVGTRNHRPGTEGQEAIRALAARVKKIVQRGDLPTTPTDAFDATDHVSLLVDAWITNGAVKAHSPEAIMQSLRALENMTLLPVRRLAGVDLDTVRRRLEELGHAN